MESILQEKIESLRFEMMKQATLNGSLTHDKVVFVSQLLDRYIVLYQKVIMKKARLKLIS